MTGKMGIIIVYTPNPKHTPKERTKFFRKLHGYTDKSNFGKHVYNREGLLSKISHLRPNRAVIVIDEKDETKVLSFLKTNGVTVYARKIILEKDDIKQLSKKSERND